MIRKVAQYKVKRAEVKAVEQAIIKFVDAVAENEPHTVYEAYQGREGVSWGSYYVDSGKVKIEKWTNGDPKERW